MVVELVMKKSDPNHGEERLTEVRQSRNFKKVEKKGSGRTIGGMDQQDGAGRAWRRDLCTEKWVSAHTHWRVELRPLEKSGTWQGMDDYFLMGFPPMCRSASCSLEYEVAGRRRASRKKSLVTRRSGDGSGGGGFRKENKVTKRKHGHQKRS